jgi:glucose/arabinose dehydrogenase
VDPTRAAISKMNLDGSGFTRRAHKIRNAIALTVNPATGSLWAGDAGQDDLAFGHPYEFLDDVSAHPGDADYGWPECEENHHVYVPGSDCAGQVVPRVELPAYSTIIGDVFYPANVSGPYAFPPAYRGALFAAVHGSWHRNAGTFVAPPRVVWIPMSGDVPKTSVDWNDPSVQWKTFVGGFQPGGYARNGRPTGIAVGPKGSLFVADDYSGFIYRIRPIRALSGTNR